MPGTPSERDIGVATMMVSFRSAHDAVTGYVSGGKVASSGAAGVATIHLLTRGLVDCAIAQRLATERHPIQGYSVLRPAWEAARLIDLFAVHPELAEDWVAGKHQMFTPAKVRERLGEKDDPFYSYMCALSHPRIAGVQMSMFKRLGDPEDAAVHFTEIPYEVTDSYLAVATPGIVLARLAVLVGHLKFTDSSRKEELLATTLRATADRLFEGWTAMDAALTDDERHDPNVHDLAGRAEWFRKLLNNLADEIDRVYQAPHPPE